MDVLFKTIGDKSSIDRILLLCQRKFSDLVPIGRKEFTFVSAEDIAGKFRTYYPFPGWKRFEMLVENANEGQFDEIEEMGNELFA